MASDSQFHIPEAVLSDIAVERLKQDVRWGGSGHDDTHGSHDWLAFILKHSGRAVTWPFNLATFRRQMVRVAALAIAAIEWSDRLAARSKQDGF